MHKIQEIFKSSFSEFLSHNFVSNVQLKASSSIMNCKTGTLGWNSSICSDCGHLASHNNSCRNRNCPCCQAVLRESWIDSRKAEVLDCTYFHAVFTLPMELRPLIYQNQALLYSLIHKCVSQTILALAKDNRYLGGTPGIIQVLHTFGQELNYHPHIHCIISGVGLTAVKQLTYSKKKFLIPVKVLSKMFRGKFLAALQKLYSQGKLSFFNSCLNYQDLDTWNIFRNALYQKDFVVYIKETFNGFGNVIDYLGRYSHRIAISNARIKSLTDTHVTFSAKDYKTGKKKPVILTKLEFIRRFLMHVLPSGFQKIRYYGFLTNCAKKKNLKILQTLMGKFLQKSFLEGLSHSEKLLALWNIDINICPACGCSSMRHIKRTFYLRN